MVESGEARHSPRSASLNAMLRSTAPIAPWPASTSRPRSPTYPPAEILRRNVRLEPRIASTNRQHSAQTNRSSADPGGWGALLPV